MKLTRFCARLKKVIVDLFHIEPSVLEPGDEIAACFWQNPAKHVRLSDQYFRNVAGFAQLPLQLCKDLMQIFPAHTEARLARTLYRAGFFP